MKKNIPITLLLFGFSVLWLSLAGCISAPEKGQKPSSDWSRGVSIGNAARGSSGMALSDQGDRIHLVWPADTSEGIRLHYLKIDRTATPILERELELPPGWPRTPRLVTGSQGQIHLIWASRTSSRELWQLWYGLLNSEGFLVTPPRQLSPEANGVGTFAVASDRRGGVVIIWDNSKRENIYGTHLSPEGEPVSPRIDLATAGSAPSVRVDSEQKLHLVWRHKGQVLYASMPVAELGSSNLETGIPVAELKTGTGDSLSGPYLGISHGWNYVFWAVQSRSGLEAGTSHTEFIAFPEDRPAPSKSHALLVMPVEDLPYIAFDSPPSITQLVPPASVRLSTDYVFQPDVDDSDQDRLVLAFAAAQQLRRDSVVQIAFGIFQDGQFQGYGFGGKTPRFSSSPVIASDAKGYLHLAWLEGGTRQIVYYASTAPETKKALDRLDSGDFANLILGGGLESFATILLFPVVGTGWLLPGLVLLGIWKLIRDDENLTHPVSIGVLILSMLIFQAAKLVTLPTIATYVPFSAWIQVPLSWELPLRILTPVAIIGTSIFAAEMGRRHKSNSTLRYYITVGLIDTVLTLGVYGVNFLGV